MSTRSFICKKYGDKFKAIYCHCDGYPEGVGTTLENYYTDDKVIDSLIELGDISYLDKYVSPPSNTEHSWLNPVKDVTVAYHRDGGEEKIVREFDTFYNMLKNANECWCDFLYYWHNGKWDIYINGGTTGFYPY